MPTSVWTEQQFGNPWSAAATLPSRSWKPVRSSWCAPAEMRRYLRNRDGPNCSYCTAPDAATLDHVVPRSRGGSYEIENLVLACGPCNNAKGDREGVRHPRAR